MAQLGRDLLSETPSLVWIAALATVLLFHCSHLFHMRGEPRWYHSAHVVVLLGMLYMFAGAAFGLHLLPPSAWTLVYVATSTAILGWMLIRLARGRSFKKLWAVALVQQVAMIYMWAPMRVWLPLLTFGFVLYFIAEVVAWLANAYSKLEPLATAEAPARHFGGSLEPRSVFGDLCMTIMAASMAYMFVSMQLMAPTTCRPGQVADNRSAAPSVATPTPHQAQSAPEAPPRVAKLPPSPEPEIAASGGGKSYTIVAGDTLRTIAARVYGRAGLWDRIAKANPGLDPRHLRVGRVIKLPAPEPRR